MDGLTVDAKDGGLAGRGREGVTGIGCHAGYVRSVVERDDVVFGKVRFATEGEFEFGGGGGGGEVVDGLWLFVRKDIVTFC